MSVFVEMPLKVVAQVVRQPAPPPVLTSGTWYYVGLALLVVTLIVASVTAYRVWVEIHDVEEPDTPADLLEAFKEARAAGELNASEFDRVKRQLAQAESPPTSQVADKPLPPT